VTSWTQCALGLGTRVIKTSPSSTWIVECLIPKSQHLWTNRGIEPKVDQNQLTGQRVVDIQNNRSNSDLPIIRTVRSPFHPEINSWYKPSHYWYCLPKVRIASVWDDQPKCCQGWHLCELDEGLARLKVNIKAHLEQLNWSHWILDGQPDLGLGWAIWWRQSQAPNCEAHRGHWPSLCSCFIKLNQKPAAHIKLLRRCVPNDDIWS